MNEHVFEARAETNDINEQVSGLGPRRTNYRYRRYHERACVRGWAWDERYQRASVETSARDERTIDTAGLMNEHVFEARAWNERTAGSMCLRPRAETNEFSIPVSWNEQVFEARLRRTNSLDTAGITIEQVFEVPF